MGERPNVLVVDDDASMRELMVEQLLDHGYRAIEAPSAAAALEAIARHRPDAVVTDIRMPGGEDGLALCRRASARWPELPVLVMTAFGSMERAIEAMRAGAFDFLPKPFRFDVLDLALKRALRLEAPRQGEGAQGEAASSRAVVLHGTSPAIARVRELVACVARMNLPVTVHGESGVGKELVARAIHALSARSEGPYVTLNCAALPTDLLESELFGHTRGAFSGADHERRGLIRSAHGGTLLLDEIGDMPLGLQAKLLRVLEDKRVRPVGSDRAFEVDVRLVSATHRALHRMASEGRFRLDLLYRLNGVTIEVPPLRERPEDVAVLAALFLEEAQREEGRAVAQRFTPEALEVLTQRAWPGNVRELKSAVRVAAAMCPASDIAPRYVQGYPEESGAVVRGQRGGSGAPLGALEDVVREHILRVLASVDGNKSRAARILGIDRKTLYAKLERYQQEPGAGEA